MTDDPMLAEERFFELMDETGTSVGLGFLPTAGFSRFARPSWRFWIGSAHEMGGACRILLGG